MTSLSILCFIAVVSISAVQTTEGTEIRRLRFRIKCILNIPECKAENRAQAAKLNTNRCDLKLKITLNGTELPSFRFQSDQNEFNFDDSDNILGFQKIIKRSRGDEMKLKIQVYDYDQHNYNPDRLLMNISVPVKRSLNYWFEYVTCNAPIGCAQDHLPVSLASDLNAVINDKAPSLQFGFRMCSTYVRNDVALPEIKSKSKPVLYEGTLKLNLISDKLRNKAEYLFTISDRSDKGGNELIGNKFRLKANEHGAFEAIYSEEFESQSESTWVTIKIETINDQYEKSPVTDEYKFLLQFNDIDHLHPISKGDDFVDAFVYIQVRGISNKKIDSCNTYTAKFSIVSFNWFNGKKGLSGEPWIRVTAESTTTGTRTIFENHFLKEGRSKMTEEDAALFTNGTLTGFPQEELDHVTIKFTLREDDSFKEGDGKYMPFFLIHHRKIWGYEMDKDNKDDFTMLNFNSSSGGKCVKYIPEDATKDDHNLCSRLTFEEDPCTTTSTTTTSTTTTTTTPTTTTTTTTLAPATTSTSTSTKKATTTTASTTSTTTTAAEVNEEVVESGSSGGTAAGIVISILLIIAIVAGFLYYRHRSNKVEPVKIEEAIPKDALVEKQSTTMADNPPLKSASKLKLEPTRSTVELMAKSKESIHGTTNQNETK